jgi:hypothetical protein
MEKSINPNFSSELVLFMHIHGIKNLQELLELSEEDLAAMEGFSVHLLLEINSLRKPHLNSDSDSVD